MGFEEKMAEELFEQVLSNHLILSIIATHLPFTDLLEYSQVNHQWRSLCRKNLRSRICSARMESPLTIMHSDYYEPCSVMKSFNDLLKDSDDPPFSGIRIQCDLYGMHGNRENCSKSCLNTSEKEDPNPLETLFPSFRKAPDLWKWVDYRISGTFNRCPAIRAFRRLFVENSMKIEHLNLSYAYIERYPLAFQHLTKYAKSTPWFPNLKYLNDTNLDFYMSIRGLAPQLKEITCAGSYSSAKHPIAPEDFYARLSRVELNNYMGQPKFFSNSQPKILWAESNFTDSIDNVNRLQMAILNMGASDLYANLSYLDIHVLNAAFISIQNIPLFVNLRTLQLWIRPPNKEIRLEKSGLQFVNFTMFPGLERVILNSWISDDERKFFTAVQFQEMDHQQQVSLKVRYLELQQYDFRIHGLAHLAHLFPNVKHLKFEIGVYNKLDQQSRNDLYLKGNFKVLETLEADSGLSDQIYCPTRFLQNFLGRPGKSTPSQGSIANSRNVGPEDLTPDDFHADNWSSEIFQQTQLKQIILHLPHYNCILQASQGLSHHSVADAVQEIEKLFSIATMEHIRACNSQLNVMFTFKCDECSLRYKFQKLRPVVRSRLRRGD